MDIEKATSTGYRTEMFMPIMKTAEGDYIAVLSDDSTDRDEEIVGKQCIQAMSQDDEYLAALCNHDNDIFMMVADWRNKRVEEVDGHTALIAEPYFYKSNPNAQIIRGMLDEGAKPGISIGAIVKNYDEIDGKRVYTELEIVEASFVGVPSNRHGRALAVAKSFSGKLNRIYGGVKVEKEYTQKDVDSAVEKKVEELNTDFQKKLDDKDAEISKMKESVSAAEQEKQAALDKAKENEDKVATLEANLEKEKKAALEKMQYASQGGEEDNGSEDAEKSFGEGKLPIMRM